MPFPHMVPAGGTAKPSTAPGSTRLVRQGYLARTGDRYPVISLTGRSDELLKGRCRVMLPAPEKGSDGIIPCSPRRKAGTGRPGPLSCA